MTKTIIKTEFQLKNMLLAFGYKYDDTLQSLRDAKMLCDMISRKGRKSPIQVAPEVIGMLIKKISTAMRGDTNGNI